ncbi:MULTISPECIES: hypothetical protein [Pontibacillus]|uniref:Uncharacterized protein n=1 Tax=Pontibacillus chungwhensis TaxID=265426 RepID=A0ABY8V0C1_9BACI|nr:MULTISPECIES: hypothetical protein [Pontibacillus]MCD5324628.1 hypothetical protein [Pontibacillus sp. HN14]WIF99078.1 hypothetical protein QNI29_05330 [Pontibacillus chungwhensis]
MIKISGNKKIVTYLGAFLLLAVVIIVYQYYSYSSKINEYKEYIEDSSVKEIEIGFATFFGYTKVYENVLSQDARQEYYNEALRHSYFLESYFNRYEEYISNSPYYQGNVDTKNIRTFIKKIQENLKLYKNNEYKLTPDLKKAIESDIGVLNKIQVQTKIPHSDLSIENVGQKLRTLEDALPYGG